MVERSLSTGGFFVGKGTGSEWIRSNVDPKPDAIPFIPITAMVVIVAVVMIAVLVPESVPIVIAIVCPGRAGRSKSQSGKDRAHDEEHSSFTL